MKREFDQYSDGYNELLKDPVRDRFMGDDSQFFHLRKRDLIREYFRQKKIATREMAYLDLGCGKGELAGLLAGDFGRVCGCDPSEGMLQCAAGIETHVQQDPGVIPFADASFDFVSAVCVYHHVPPHARASLTMEVKRVLKPGGTFVLIEHNPFNPVTTGIVKRTPIDHDAILLKPDESRELMSQQGLSVCATQFFLYLPERLYGAIGGIERMLEWLPLGGQYAMFGQRV